MTTTIIQTASTVPAFDMTLSHNLQIIQVILLLAIPVCFGLGIVGAIVRSFAKYQKTDRFYLRFAGLGGLAVLIGGFGTPIALVVSFIFNSLANPFI